MIPDEETLAMIVATRAAAGRTPISPEAMRDIAETHPLREDPTFDMVLHLLMLRQAESA